MIPRHNPRVKSRCQEDGPHKPSSVRRPGRRAGSSVWDPDHSGPRAAYPGLERGRRPQSPLFGLAPDGVCRATPVASGPVRSYRTLSPLPVPRCRGHRRFALCCTFRHLAVPGRYPASCPVELGLSSARRVRRTPGGDPLARPPGQWKMVTTAVHGQSCRAPHQRFDGNVCFHETDNPFPGFHIEGLTFSNSHHIIQCTLQRRACEHPRPHQHRESRS